MAAAFCVLLVLATQLSDSDSQVVATQNPSQAGAGSNESTGPVLNAPLIKKAIDGLSTVGEALTQIGEGAASETASEAPDAVVWVRLSKSYLAKRVEREVDRRKPVRDLILGTTITGESHTTGTTRFVLHPNDREALGEIEFVGEVHAKTVGRNGPATLQYLSDSTFRARKKITMGASGPNTSPAVAVAPTRLTATSIQTNKPGLRGRIVQRIAWRRVAESQAEADAIASDHTAADIRHDLDRKTDESFAAIRKQVQTQIAKFNVDGEDRPMLMRSRSTPDYIEVAVCRGGTNREEFRMPSFTVEGNPDIAVRVHRTMLARVLGDPELREKIGPAAGGIFASGVGQAGTSDGKQSATPTLAMDGEWLAFTLTNPSGQNSSPRVAAEETLRGQRVR
jgi:hypothetical protein